MEERDLGVHKSFMVCNSNILFSLKENRGCGLAEEVVKSLFKTT
jgi:hypothetical protein